MQLAFGKISPYIANSELFRSKIDRSLEVAGQFNKHSMMKQKSRLLFIASWLVLRLRWSLIFLQKSLSNADAPRWWAKPGIILYTRRQKRLPLDCWSFDENRRAYVYSDPSLESMRVCFLPESSRN